MFPVFWITSIPLSRKPWLALSPRRGLTLQPASLVWGCSPTLSAPPTMPFSSCRIRRRNSLSRRPGRPICLRTPRSPLRPVRAQLLQPSGSRVLISRRNAAFLLCRARRTHPRKTGSLPLGLPPGTLWLIPGPPIFCRGRRSQQATSPSLVTAVSLPLTVPHSPARRVASARLMTTGVQLVGSLASSAAAFQHV